MISRAAGASKLGIRLHLRPYLVSGADAPNDPHCASDLCWCLSACGSACPTSFRRGLCQNKPEPNLIGEGRCRLKAATQRRITGDLADREARFAMVPSYHAPFLGL